MEVHMKMRMVVVSACFGSLMMVSSVYGQAAQRGSFSRDPCYPTSLISVDEVLRGTPPPSNTIAITQLGGRVSGCSLTVTDNPIVELREEYILFLVGDQKPHIPNNSGSPRYVPYGVYGGKAKIVNGKIQFSPSAPARLREYDNTELGTFKDIIKRGGDVRKLRRDVPPGLITP